MVRMFAAIATVAALMFAGTASASDNGTKDQAVAMVKRVEAMFAKDGAEATFKAVSDKSVEDKTRYVEKVGDYFVGVGVYKE